MPAAIAFVVVAVVVVGVIVVAVVRQAVQRSEQQRAVAADPALAHLRYVVPAGHDAAHVVAALEREGFASTAELEPRGHVVVIACPAGTDRDRARVRATIQHSQGSELEVPEVRFLDESASG